MGDALLQLGVGGIFAILVIRVVFDFLGKQKRNGKSGELDPAYWKQEFRAAVHDEVSPLADRTRDEIREIKSLLGKIMDRLPPPNRGDQR